VLFRTVRCPDLAQRNDSSLNALVHVYILECRDHSFYVGSTKHLERRVAQHQRGEGAAYTRRRLPVRLVFACEFDRIDEAFALEKQIQNWSRAKRLALINGELNELPALAKKHFPPKAAE
jgi:predicted GIY-YIG superfamily endonuclease